MKKKYIAPAITSMGMDEQPLMAGSDKFRNDPEIDIKNPASELEVTSKRHNLWDTEWDTDEEDD